MRPDSNFSFSAYGNSNTETFNKLSTHNPNELAGIDFNDASVIIIDNQPDILPDEAFSEAGDFEEVLSKRQKKQRLLQIEEERRKELKEKEKVEKLQAKKKLQQKKPDPKGNRKGWF